MDFFKNLEAKFVKDTFWLYLSFFVFALSGLFINLFILFNFNIDDLGIFIQIYTIYLIWSQFSVFGMNDSVQRNVAFNIKDKDEILHIKFGALLNGFFIGGFFSILLYLFSEKIGYIVQSYNVGLGLKLTGPAILFFTLNKIFLGILNGERRIKLYSIAQSLRSFLVFIIVIILGVTIEHSYKLAYSFLITEIVLFIFLLNSKTIINISQMKLKRFLFWTKFHFIFGSKSFPVGFLYESYLKVDILMISFYLDDYRVGIYSFAAMFFEGLYQIPHLIKTNVNPILVRILKEEKSIYFSKFIKSMVLLSFFITLFCALAIIIIYPFLGPYFPSNIITETYLIIILLFFGLVIYSIFMPIDFIFLQAGYPIKQTYLISLNVIVNVCLNFLLIPLYGLIGAAISTSLSLIFSGAFLLIFMYYNKLISKKI